MKLEAVVTQFFAAGKTAAASNDDSELHAFRIAVKRLRYTIEILDPDGGREWLKRLRLVQKELGQMNDAVVAERYLNSIPKLSQAAKPIPAKLKAEAQSHIAAFRKTWQRSFGIRSEKAWLTWARAIEY